MHTAQLIARIKSAVDNNNYVVKGHELSMRSLIHLIDTGGTVLSNLGPGSIISVTVGNSKSCEFGPVSDSNQLDKPKTMEDWCELFPRGASVNAKGVPHIDVEISIKWPPPEASDEDDDDDADADNDDNDDDNDGDDVGAGTKAAVKSKRVPTVAIKLERNSVKSVKSAPVNLDSGVPKVAAASSFF